MPTELLWINKDATSTRLSQSCGPAETKIRRHVQQSKRASGVIPSPKSRTKKVQQQRKLKSSLIEFPPWHTLSAFTWNVQWRSLMELSLAERRSFSFFVERTSKAWSGWQDEHFWSETSLKLCEHPPSIAHALISFAALHESRSVQDAVQKRKLASFSLNQRDKAIEKAISTCPEDPLLSLASCLALVCLQNIQHGHHSFRILFTAMKLVAQCENELQQDSLVQQVRPLLQSLPGRLCMMVDPILALDVSIKQRAKSLRSSPVSGSLPEVLDHFETTAQARENLQAIFVWFHDHFAATAACNRIPIRPFCDLWIRRVDHMHLQGRDKAIEVSRLTLLKAACLFGQILFESLCAPTQGVPYQQTENFNSIMNYVERANEIYSRDNPEPQMSFGIDDGLVDILTFVAHNCRNLDTRRRATQLLLSSERVEGGRLCYTAGLIANAAIELEESSSTRIDPPGQIHGHQQWRLEKGEQFFNSKKIRLVFSRPQHEDFSKDGEYRQTVIDMPTGIQTLDPGEVTCNHGLADVIFGRGYVSFLENREKGQYQLLENGVFFFPMPRG